MHDNEVRECYSWYFSADSTLFLYCFFFYTICTKEFHELLIWSWFKSIWTRLQKRNKSRVVIHWARFKKYNIHSAKKKSRKKLIYFNYYFRWNLKCNHRKPFQVSPTLKKFFHSNLFIYKSPRIKYRFQEF